MSAKIKRIQLLIQTFAAPVMTGGSLCSKKKKNVCISPSENLNLDPRWSTDDFYGCSGQ